MKKLKLTGLSRDQKRYYREKEERLKEEYKDKNGLEIARGFDKSEEFKRLQKNIRNTQYKSRRKELTELGLETYQKEDSVILNDGDLFFSALPYGNDLDSEITDMFTEYLGAGGPKPVIIIEDLDGNQLSYKSELAATEALSRLYKDASDHQSSFGRTSEKQPDGTTKRRYNKYVVIDSAITFGDNEVFLTVFPRTIDR